MGYFKTTVRAGATIEVTKSYTKRIGVKIKKDREKPTAEEMEKVNQMNAERTLRLKINANFGVDDPFITLTYRKDERPTPKQAKKNIKKVEEMIEKWDAFPLLYLKDVLILLRQFHIVIVYAPVAQGIEHRPPEAGAAVRIRPGAPKKEISSADISFNFYFAPLVFQNRH